MNSLARSGTVRQLHPQKADVEMLPGSKMLAQDGSFARSTLGWSSLPQLSKPRPAGAPLLNGEDGHQPFCRDLRVLERRQVNALG
jgi:hypothetical protein